jgi:CDGSH-type Zn-finger protein
MADPGHVRIRVSENGPYLVEGPVPVAKQTIVTDAAGESVAWEETERVEQGSCALCRCGGSNVKPYCDGTHVAIAFDGTETASRTPYAQAATSVDGPAIRLMDQFDLCAEARFCSAKGEIWNRVTQDDPDSLAVVVEQSELCPSGRYTAVDLDTRLAHEPDLEPSIGIVEDPQAGVSGPLWVRGGVPVVSADGEPYEVRNRMTLCRCGASKNKPFCDSTHVDIGFDAGE